MLLAGSVLSASTLLAGVFASAHAAPGSDSSGHNRQTVAGLYNNIRQNPELLRVFLQEFPKGADLHNHLVGAVYAESFLRWAAEDGLCLSLSQGSILGESCGPRNRAQGFRPGAEIVHDDQSWNFMVDSLSMRDFVPEEADRSGHDHFFSSFAKFAPVAEKHGGDMLAEALNHAAQDHVTYVELMISPVLGPISRAGKGLLLYKGAGLEESLTKADAILAPALPALVRQAMTEVDRMEARARIVLHCDTPSGDISGGGISQDSAEPPAPGCAVRHRYLFQALRIVPPDMLYAQLSAGYALVRADRRFVGLNIVAPEDSPIAVADYDMHMQMFGHLNRLMPGIPLSLHAGELTPGLVPPDVASWHIRAAVEQAGARRIGHGVDVLWERDPAGLMAEMARKNILVEINLTSNEEILGIKGAAHPFMLYRAMGVPVALSTDDEGVSRGSLTQEYRLAVQRYPLSYPDLVQLSRAGLAYSFLPGENLWVGNKPGKVRAECASISLGSDLAASSGKALTAKARASCQAFLAKSEKASMQWALEAKLAGFEANILQNPVLKAGLANSELVNSK